ncbi:MAG TPA: c-type cytochrome [Gemmatimonadota bacterium]|nr:c-type cytochrome [Gemmatimonadota bacterium]
MRRSAYNLGVGILAIALAACGGGGPDQGEAGDGAPEGAVDTGAGTAPETPARASEVASGEAVYAANCALCHGDDGRGEGQASIGLEPPPADFTDREWKTGDGSLAAIKNTIENGSPGTAMIGWRGTLTDAEIDAVARHVLSFGGGTAGGP